MSQNCYLSFLCKKVSDSIPFVFTSNSNKPSHVANNLFRCCLGKRSKLNNLYQWMFATNKKSNKIISCEQLLNEYKDCFEPGTNISDIKFFRSMLFEIFNQDNTMYPSEEFSCVTSTSVYTVKKEVRAEQKIGSFIYGVLRTEIQGKQSPAIDLIVNALKSKDNAFSTIIKPLCNGISQDSTIDEYTVVDRKLNRFEKIIRDSFDCLSENIKSLGMEKNSILVLQRMVSLADFCALFYFININNINKNNIITPILFDSGINLNSIVRASHETYILAKQNIENFFIDEIYKELKNSISNTDESCKERINSMPLANEESRKTLKRLYDNKKSDENFDALMNLAKSLQETIYTYEFKDCTPGEFLSTCLGMRNGVIGPKGNNAIRRFYPSKFIIENLVLSTINYSDLQDGIEYTEFGHILQEKFNIIVGINNDFECSILDLFNIKKNSPGDLLGDLHKNSLVFADIIISLGYGKRYADGVTMIGCDL